MQIRNPKSAIGNRGAEQARGRRDDPGSDAGARGARRGRGGAAPRARSGPRGGRGDEDGERTARTPGGRGARGARGGGAGGGARRAARHPREPGPDLAVYQLRRQPPPFAFTQFCWTRKSLPPTCMFAVEPLEVVYVAPKSQAHLSAFSLPALSYHALRSWSVFVSSVSCARVFTSASAAGSLVGGPFRVWESCKVMWWGVGAGCS